MTLRRSLTLHAASICIVVAACSSNGATGSGDSDIPFQDAELVAQGEPLYQASCASCHGADLRGTDKGPSHLSIIYEPNHHGDGAFILAALRGVPQHHWRSGDMPPVPGLSEEDPRPSSPTYGNDNASTDSSPTRPESTAPARLR